MFYNDRENGCQVPAQAFGLHMPPIVNPSVVITITDAAGAAVTSFPVGAELTISMDTFNPGAFTHAWVHASAGAPPPFACLRTLRISDQVKCELVFCNHFLSLYARPPVRLPALLRQGRLSAVPAAGTRILAPLKFGKL